MAFVPKEWKDRLVEFAGRRKLTNVSTGEEMIVDVVRNEGAVSQEGDAFSAANMSDLEQRVADEFNNINTNLTHIEKIYEFGTKDITEVTVKDLKQYKFIHIFCTDSNNVRSSYSITLPLAIFALGYTQDMLFLGASTNYSNVIDTYSTVKYINDTTIQVYNRGGYKTIVYGIK